MLIDASHAEETRVAVVDGTKVEEFDFESITKKQIAGNVYLAKVTRVEPSLQAAFVDYGGNRHGFLAFNEIHPDYYQIPAHERAAIVAAETLAVRAETEREERGGRRGAARAAQPEKDKDNAKEKTKPQRQRRERVERGRWRRRNDRPKRAAPFDALTREVTLEDGVVAQLFGPGGDEAFGWTEETRIALDGGWVARLHGPRSDDDVKADAPAPQTEPAAETPAEPEAPAGLEAQITLEDGVIAQLIKEPAGRRRAQRDERGAAKRRTRKPAAAKTKSAKNKPAEDTEAVALAKGEALEAQVTLEDGAEAALIKADAAPPRRRRRRKAAPQAALRDAEISESFDEAIVIDEDDDQTDESGDGDHGDEGDADNEQARIDNRVRRALSRRYKIQDVIKRRQILLVQVVKEERGNKGAALTTYLSVPGRYCVLMPNTGSGGGISRKITSAADRKRLKDVAQSLEVPEGMGLIIRTAGAMRPDAEIRRDYDYLLRQWNAIRDLTLRSIAPALIYEEGDLIKRVIRDQYSPEIDGILVEGEAGYENARAYMEMLSPEHAHVVKRYADSIPLFIRYQVESQLAAMFNPVCTLKSGGYIVIGATEALVAIDVNSGKSTRENSIEDTALKTNLEAAEEIARQLRLRDLAGLVVIDFIDMEDPRNNRAVERRMKDCLRQDRARTQISRISSFGLMEMSRQRLRPGVLEASTQPCPHCQGMGVIRSDESIALAVLRAVEEEGVRARCEQLTVKAPVQIANFLLNQKRARIATIEQRYGLALVIEGDVHMRVPDFTLERVKGEGARPMGGEALSPESGFQIAEDEPKAAAQPQARPQARRPEPEPAADNAEDDGRGRRGRRGGRRRRREEDEERSPASEALRVIDLAEGDESRHDAPAEADAFSPNLRAQSPNSRAHGDERRGRNDARRNKRGANKRGRDERKDDAAKPQTGGESAEFIDLGMMARPDALDVAAAQVFTDPLEAEPQAASGEQAAQAEAPAAAVIAAPEAQAPADAAPEESPAEPEAPTTDETAAEAPTPAAEDPAAPAPEAPAIAPDLPEPEPVKPARAGWWARSRR